MTDIEKTLQTFCAPGQVVSVQALKIGTARARSQCLGDLAAAAKLAAQWDAECPLGLYLTPNPIRPDLAGSSAFPKDEDVVERHWLLIDCDPARPSGTSTSQAEVESAWRVLDRCRSLLDTAGLVNPVVAFSGNGWHLCYPLLLPNDASARELIKTVLKGLQVRCGDEVAKEEDAELKAGRFLPVPKTKVGTECHDAKRIWPIYGTWKRKGTNSAERPHRLTSLVEVASWDRTAGEKNGQALRRLVDQWRLFEDRRRGRPETSVQTYAAAALRQELAAVAQATVGDRNNQLNRSAFALGQLVGAGTLARPEVEAALEATAVAAGLDGSEVRATVRSGLDSGLKQPRDLSAVGTLYERNGTNGHANGSPGAARPPLVNADTSNDPMDQDATAADLIEANVTVRWGWQKWLPAGVLSVLASEPGVGKTRFCADLARRVYHALPWPDGADPSFEKGSRTLWVPADNQHAELGTIPSDFGFPPEVLYLNATRRNPFAGTMLDDQEDLRDFETRIRRVRPAVVFIDTSLNATDRSAHKPEDAKAFFVPLQQIAARTGVVLLLVTHLNAAGKPLGKRIQGQARLVMQLEKPDPNQEHRRKLYVVKSNSLYPAPLGVTMGSTGNDYDLNPPSDGTEMTPENAPELTKLQACKEWLFEQLSDAPKRVGNTRTAAELAGFSVKTLYTAMRQIEVVEYLMEGRKWWRLTLEE